MQILELDDPKPTLDGMVVEVKWSPMSRGLERYSLAT